MDNKFLNKISTFLLYISILTFIIAFNFADNPQSGWYQQFLPDLNGRPISDITFLDSLVGYAVTPYTANDTAYIIKTTNGGDSWFIIKRQQTNIEGGFNRIEFINSKTGFAGGNFIFKTTNEGNNWFPINSPTVFDDMFVLNEDTIWGADHIAIFGGLYRTTNGGTSWTLQFNKPGSGNPNKVYFYNNNIGFITGGSFLWKTTNSGIDWIEISGSFGFQDIYFIDNLTGWKCNEGIQKTTDGGLTWFTQTLPPKGTPVIYNGTILLSRIRQFSNINKDTIWGVGSSAFFGAGRFRGLIYKSTNGGDSWGYQLPDTNINIETYPLSNFVNKNNGWSYNRGTGVHTVTGGMDTTIYVGIENLANTIPEKFKLHQNYPNPFNPKTIINYELQITSYVTLKVYSIDGKEIRTLLSRKQNAGEYKIDFDGSNLTSGVYFYSMFVKEKELIPRK